jgi:1-acyl-sn-glycerol-3-phosphate acyltransferase
MSDALTPLPRRVHFHQWVIWRCAHVLLTTLMVIFYRLRWSGREHVPQQGPVLLLSNHQSFLDPVIVGVAAYRPFFSMARESLFRNRLFGSAIRTTLAIPVGGAAGETAVLRNCVQLLRDGNALLVFPEGTRTLDGRTQPFKPGLMLLIKRSRATVVPVAIEGAFEAWPRARKLPRVGPRIDVMCGQAIAGDELAQMPTDQALARLQGVIEGMRLELHARRRGR